MLTIFYEEYYCDYHRKDYKADFHDLEDLEDWIFSQMQQDYSDKDRGRYVMSFPTPEKASRLQENGPWEISFHPKYSGPDIWIHMIKSDYGIIFSDGKRTAGQKHWSKEVKEWLTHCEERRCNPKFQFAE